jgi:hypothetical protein
LTRERSNPRGIIGGMDHFETPGKKFIGIAVIVVKMAPPTAAAKNNNCNPRPAVIVLVVAGVGHLS